MGPVDGEILVTAGVGIGVAVAVGTAVAVGVGVVVAVAVGVGVGVAVAVGVSVGVGVGVAVAVGVGVSADAEDVTMPRITIVRQKTRKKDLTFIHIPPMIHQYLTVRREGCLMECFHHSWQHFVRSSGNCHFSIRRQETQEPP
jgi:hypothetical protein